MKLLREINEQSKRQLDVDHFEAQIREVLMDIARIDAGWATKEMVEILQNANQVGILPAELGRQLQQVVDDPNFTTGDVELINNAANQTFGSNLIDVSKLTRTREGDAGDINMDM